MLREPAGEQALRFYPGRGAAQSKFLGAMNSLGQLLGGDSPSDGGNQAARLHPSQKVGGGRYVLLRRLGGEVSVVWLAREEDNGRSVALKFLPPAMTRDEPAMRELRQRVQKIRSWHHPHIVRLHGLEESPGETPFLAMECVEGASLATICRERKGGALPWATLDPLARQLCDALAYAHGEKMLHLALKPANLLTTPQGQLKVADFGVAALLHEFADRGTPGRDPAKEQRWQSPQRRAGDLPRVSDDIYSLGATLQALLDGPAEGEDQPEDEPAAPGEARRPARPPAPPPKEVIDCLADCVAEEAARRPETIEEIITRMGWNEPDPADLAFERSLNRAAGTPPRPGVLVRCFRSPAVQIGLRVLAVLGLIALLWWFFED